MKKIKSILTIVLLFVSCGSYGQQLPDHVLYTNNMFLINPAYAGIPEAISFSTGFRKQWVGFKDAPRILNFSGHGYIPRYKIGAGLYGEQYETGAVKQTSVFSSYSYKLDLGFANLNFGLQAGLVSFRTHYTDADLNDVYDPKFNTDISQTKFNAGAGAFLYAEKYYAGFSSPVMFTYNKNEHAPVKMDLQFLTTGGYLFDINEKIVLKPNAMLKIIQGSPFNYMLGLNGYYNEMFGLGLQYKSERSMAVTLDFAFNKYLYIAYAYEFPGSTDISTAQSGSHEFVLSYILFRDKEKSPAFRFY